ncbi:cyclase family protein [Mesorhizobium sp. 1B3]|uniref:cyclase family protein n=1 Tax=Mesorhizobium sp. 1B3 TaxID=3243599 RepID=UPI003D9513F8
MDRETGRATTAEQGRQRNWGRWGSEDEQGLANLLTPERVAAAARLVRTGRVFNLSLPVEDRSLPVLPGRPAPQHYLRRTGTDYAAGVKRKGGFEAMDDVIMLATHGATHVDALAHVGDEGRLFNDVPIAAIRSNGASRLGIDKCPPLVGRGVLLDLCRHLGVERLQGGEVITDIMLEDCARAQGTPVEPGTIVLVRTGWMSVFASEGSKTFFASEPGIGMEAARWLADHDAVAIALDNFAVEVIPTESGIPAPVHRFLIRDCGMYLMELFKLDELAEAGVHEFLFVAGPLGIVGGLGSPLTPLAIA